MPLYYCRSCNHEWESTEQNPKKEQCGWCKEKDVVMLEKKTPLERLLEKEDFNKLLKELEND